MGVPVPELTVPQGQFFGVPLTDAARVAVVGAVLGGFFSIFKEAFAAGLQLLIRRGDARRARRALYGRLAQHYFQMGVGAWKALAAWKKATDDVTGFAAATGVEAIGIAPDPAFLARYDDPQLATDVLQLAAEDPDIVTAYIQALTVRDRAREVHGEEDSEFMHVRYSYPRTRNALRVLMEHTTTYLRAVAPHLPGRWLRIRWLRVRKLSAREKLIQGADQIGAALAEFPRVELNEILREAAAARAKLKASS